MMRKSKLKTLIFICLALLFIMVNTMAATPEKQASTVSGVSGQTAMWSSLTPGPYLTYYGSGIRIYFRNHWNSYVNDLDIYLGGWWWPRYYRFPWWYCYNPYYYPAYYYFPWFDLIWYPYYGPSYPYPVSVHRMHHGSYLYPGHYLYYGWWHPWPYLRLLWIRWTRDGYPVGPFIPVLAYWFYWGGPWYGASSPSDGSEIPGKATAVGMMNLTLSNNDPDPNNIVVIDSLDIGYSNKMYPLDKLTGPNLDADPNIIWQPRQIGIEVASNGSKEITNLPASEVGMIYRAVMHLKSAPGQTIEYIVQYSTGAWSTEFPYKKDDIVAYNDNCYKCLQDHISAPGNAPPYASYWTPIAPPPTPTERPAPTARVTIPIAKETPAPTYPPPTTRPTPTPTPRRVMPTPTPTPIGGW